MDTHGNMARQIRAMVETLGEWADEYDGVGMTDQRDQIKEARDRVADLYAMPDPEDPEDSGDVEEWVDELAPDEYEHAERQIRGE